MEPVITTERQSFADEGTAALAQGVIEPFNVVRFTAAFVHRTMPFGREHRMIRIPMIGIDDCTLAVHGWQ